MIKLVFQAGVEEMSCLVNSVGHVDQWEGNESPEINQYFHSQLIFDKGTKIIQWQKDSLSTNGAGTTGQPHAKE